LRIRQIYLIFSKNGARSMAIGAGKGRDAEEMQGVERADAVQAQKYLLKHWQLWYNVRYPFRV